MELGLAGQAVTRILVDFDIYIEFEGGDTLELAEFEIADELSSGRLVVSQANLGVGVQAVLRMRNRRCVRAHFDERGSLVVEFEGGFRIDASYGDEEAWEFSGGDGRRVISGPGGKMVMWSSLSGEGV